MKRFLIILSMIFYLVFICFIVGIIVDKRASVLDSKLEALYSLAEAESPSLAIAVMETEAYWEDNEVFFAMVSDHQLTDDLDHDILMLKHYIGINDEQHLMTKIAECRSMVQEIVNDDKIALHNIF